jgi:hypothetical protein
MTNWNIVAQGLLSIQWVIECNKGENIDKTLREIWGENFTDHQGGDRLLNNGFLMMSAYLLFQYPQQADFTNIDFSKVDISKFSIDYEDNSNGDPKTLCRRLRNSLAHGKYAIKEAEAQILFHDEYKGTDKIDFSIFTVDFGVFITDFTHIVNNQIHTLSK